MYIIEDSRWIYADFLDIRSYNATVRVCLHAGRNYCFGTPINLGSVRFIVKTNSKSFFPNGMQYYLDSRAEHVDDIALAVRVSNSLPFFDENYSQLYVSEIK